MLHYRVFQKFVPIFSSFKFHLIIENTFCKRGFQGVTGGYKGLQGLQRVTRG